MCTFASPVLRICLVKTAFLLRNAREAHEADTYRGEDFLPTPT